MDSELERSILKLYPEYRKLFGPYKRQQDGRSIVVLYDGPDTRTTRQLAKVLLEVKIGRRLVNDETVDHENRNSSDDEPCNLRVLSRSENASIASVGNTHCLGYKQSNQERRDGSKNGQAKFDEFTVIDIRVDCILGRSDIKSIESTYNVSRKTAYNLVHGVTYSDVPLSIAPSEKIKKVCKSTMVDLKAVTSKNIEEWI